MHKQRDPCGFIVPPTTLRIMISPQKGDIMYVCKGKWDEGARGTAFWLWSIHTHVCCLLVCFSFSSSPSSSPRSHNKCVWCLVSACSLSSWYVLCNKQGIFKMEAGAFDEFQPTHEIVRRKCPIIFFRKFYCGSGNHLKICHVWTYTYEYVCVWTYSQIKKKTSGLT